MGVHITFAVLMVLQMEDKSNHQIAYFQYVQLIFCQLYVNKSVSKIWNIFLEHDLYQEA